MPSKQSFLEIEDYLEIPTWLNKCFLEKALISYKNDNSIKVHSFMIKPAAPKGENYASSMFRVQLMYSNEHKHNLEYRILVKTLCTETISLDMLTELDVFNKEIEMYAKIIPKLNKLLRNVYPSEEYFPATIDIKYDSKAILFKDLTVEGFKMALRKDGLNIIHTKMILQKLAKFHAAGAVLQELEPNIYDHFKCGMLNRRTTTLSNFYLNSLDVLTETVFEWKDYECYALKLKKLKSHFLENGTKAFDPKNHQFNTLIHGDMWSNNSMFKYNENHEPVTAVLLDFQFGVWSSPTLDLHYLFNSSLPIDLLTQHQEELVQYYHSFLVEALKSLNFQQHIPTLHELQIQFLENMFFGVIASFVHRAIMINDINDDADIEALLTNNEKAIRFRRTIYNNPKVQESVKKLLPLFDKKGLLD